ncbi:hypothetical protein [Alloactinosynnema sp. L-07]|nr:hypothetical protein [Alloactinosynnema sp. L-07]
MTRETQRSQGIPPNLGNTAAALIASRRPSSASPQSRPPRWLCVTKSGVRPCPLHYEATARPARRARRAVRRRGHHVCAAHRLEHSRGIARELLIPHRVITAVQTGQPDHRRTATDRRAHGRLRRMSRVASPTVNAAVPPMMINTHMLAPILTPPVVSPIRRSVG